MSWEDILKKVSRRERAEAEEFATEDMDNWKNENERKVQNARRLEYQAYAKRMEGFIKVVESFKDNLPDTDEAKSTLEYLINGMKKEMVKDNPTKIKHWRASIVHLLRDYEDSPIR